MNQLNFWHQDRNCATKVVDVVQEYFCDVTLRKKDMGFHALKVH